MLNKKNAGKNSNNQYNIVTMSCIERKMLNMIPVLRKIFPESQ